MSNLTKKITILGGGTSAWLTAAFLHKNLPKDYFNLTIIEGKTQNNIGVGESTLPGFPRFLEKCGFEFNEWFNYCSSTHKSGVLYEDWVNLKDIYWHPFGTLPIFNEKYTLFDLFNSLEIKNFIPYFQYYNTSVINKKPIPEIKAVHVDCNKLVNFLKEKVKINVIKEDITDITYKENNINFLHLSNKTTHTSDLYIDCLGFNSIIKLKNKTYKFKSRSDSTPFNAAIFNDVNYNKNLSSPFPYTKALCTPYGWMWQIPLQNRIGAGSVFNKDISDKEKVISWYENYWGNNNLIKSETKYVEFDSGYYENQWNGNTVSIGLSTGFIEPLEATGVQLIIDGIYNLYYSIGKGWFIDEDIKLFNSKMNVLYSNTFDFIALHYLKTNHKTKFWNFVKNTIIKNPPKSLLHRLDYISNYDYINLSKVELQQMFSFHSWIYLISQFTNYYPKSKNIKIKNDKFLLEEYLNKHS